MKDLVIIGGGISALSAAFYLKDKFPNLLVLERALSLGGSIRTLNVEDFLLERGPNSTLSREPVLALISALGMSNELLTPQEGAKNRFLGRITQTKPAELLPFPLSPWAAITSPVLSLSGKIRLLGEPFYPPTTLSDESVASFLSRRIGTEVTENVVNAVLGGIWASDIHTLSCRSALPRLWKMEQESGSLLKGAWKARSQKTPRSKIITLRSGFSSLISTLAERIGRERIRTSAEVSHIAITDNGVRIYIDGTAIDAKKVICAAPAPATAKIIATLDPELARRIETIPYAGLSVTHFAYPKDVVQHPLNGFGALIAPSKGRALLGVLFTSSLFSGRAPSEMHLLTCFSGGAVNPDLADIDKDGVLDSVIRDTNNLIRASASPKILHKYFWQHAIPNYPVGHHQLVASLRESERKNAAVRYLGNWIEGISVADCIGNAQKLAEELAEE